MQNTQRIHCKRNILRQSQTQGNGNLQFIYIICQNNVYSPPAAPGARKHQNKRGEFVIMSKINDILLPMVPGLAKLCETHVFSIFLCF